MANDPRSAMVGRLLISVPSLSLGDAAASPRGRSQRYAVLRNGAKGSGGRLCMMQESSADSRITYEHDESALSQEIWSPATETAPLEARVPGLFARLGQRFDDAADEHPPARSFPQDPSRCCICLEDVDHSPLSCSQCTMRAHHSCLERWFGGPKGMLHQPGALPKSTASCPNCRAALDWDGLVLQSRRDSRGTARRALGSLANTELGARGLQPLCE